MWHRGFNLWLVRYLYIPLGGNTNFISVIATIAFVAFWHDHTFNILLWAAVIVVCMLPELIIKRYARKYLGYLYPRQWFKYLSAFASSAYIYLLVLCNILGFGNGY
jgi:D-alanyl-lipoteichoic acid acyltransferase DltB (MBOAT superfamily)